MACLGMSLLPFLNIVNTTTVLLFVTTFMIVYWITYRPSNLPPGPLRWPLIGNLPSLIGKDTLGILRSLRKQYGDVFGLFIGQEMSVVLNGYDVIHDALVKHGSHFAYRNVNTVFPSQLVLANGKVWKDNRAFVMQAFRDLCFVNKAEKLENAILQELKALESVLDKQTKPFAPNEMLSFSLAKVMYRICVHYDSDTFDQSSFTEYLKNSEEMVRIFSIRQVMDKCFAFTKHLPMDVRKAKIEKNLAIAMNSYISSECEVSFKHYKEGDKSCLTDILLGRSSPVSKSNISLVVTDLMTAGSETSATTLAWFILYIALYPDQQRKLAKLVQNAIGERLPTLSDRAKLSYVEATILECLRIGRVAPLSVPHAVDKDVKFRGHIIPKGSTVLPNIASVHMDPNIFPEPTEFKPERFLSEDETTIVGSDLIIPFSLGPRSCLGETLARSELFMFVTFFMLKYEIVLASDLKDPPFKGVLGLTHKPQQYQVNFVKR